MCAKCSQITDVEKSAQSEPKFQHAGVTASFDAFLRIDDED